MVISVALSIASAVLTGVGAILGVAARTQMTNEWKEKETLKNEQFREGLLDQTARHVKAYDYAMKKANETTEEKES